MGDKSHEFDNGSVLAFEAVIFSGAGRVSRVSKAR